jgi:hypothetical protein
MTGRVEKTEVEVARLDRKVHESRWDSAEGGILRHASGVKMNGASGRERFASRTPAGAFRGGILARALPF